MRTSLRLAVIAGLMIALVGFPGAASAARPAPVTTSQTVALQVIYLPADVKFKSQPSHGISPANTVFGSCGSATLWVTDDGVETARFDASAASSLGIIVRADWYIDWWNSTSGVDGAFWGSTIQFSPTWGISRHGWVDSGLVYGKLTSLTVTLWNGTICRGLVPWDWEQVS